MNVRKLQDYIRQAAEKRGDSVSFSMDGTAISFEDLEATSNRIARFLGAVGCVPGDRVVLLCEKTLPAVTSLLGILKAGCTYVPLDVESPSARLGRIFQSCAPAALIVDERGYAQYAQMEPTGRPGGLRVISIGNTTIGAGVASLSDASSFPEISMEAGGPGSSPAVLLYTSGSTGVPKGVPVSHGSVVAFIDWAVEHFQIGSTDRCSSHSPLFFDLSLFDIFGSIAAMSSCSIVPSKVNLIPGDLAAFIRDEQLTQWFSVPSALSYMAQADVIADDDFPALKRVLWCGDVLPLRTLRYLSRRLPGRRFTNLYGPTEATIASSFYDITDPGLPETLPIGQPCPGEQLFVLDKNLQACPPGGIGDLYIGGVGLTEGYWNDAETTVESFIVVEQGAGERMRLFKTGDLASVDRNGLFQFHGRRDTQIKSRGYRIELSEIELALTAIDGVDEGAVIAMETSGFEAKTICAAVVASDDGLDVSSLRAQLAESLPGYMLPRRWSIVKRLPLLPNGKRDRQRIAQLFSPDSLRSEGTERAGRAETAPVFLAETARR